MRALGGGLSDTVGVDRSEVPPAVLWTIPHGLLFLREHTGTITLGDA